MRVCLVNRSEAKALENDGVVPNCENHVHISYAEAIERVGDEVTGELRWVNKTSDKRERYVTYASIVTGYSARPSGRGNVFVLQAVTR